LQEAPSETLVDASELFKVKDANGAFDNFSFVAESNVTRSTI